MAEAQPKPPEPAPAKPAPAKPAPAKPAPATVAAPAVAPRRAFFKLRDEPSIAERVALGALLLALLLVTWWFVTRGQAEQRIVSPAVLGSPAETFGSFHALWFDRALTRNLAASLWRVIQGFGLAALVGVPVGVVCGAWPRVNAFLAPISLFGRNVPVSALVPITLVWFGIEELQKVMFIFVACVMFVVFDSARAVASVHERYVQTALTLGGNSRQVLFKVLVPLALPDIFGSLRLLFGLAFGYIILAEMVNMESGLGALILVSQRRGPMEHVYLVLILITAVAYAVDRLLQSVQRSVFPWREE